MARSESFRGGDETGHVDEITHTQDIFRNVGLDGIVFREKLLAGE